jgi:glycosyltransferase involved in cell wall biosynthesis
MIPHSSSFVSGTGVRGAQRLDVLVPTYNRAALLEAAVRSVLDAAPVAGLEVHVTVICNHCTDDSRDRIAALQAEMPGRISCIEERRRGKSRALNAGIAATCGDLIGMIDDDERVDWNWVRAVAAAFNDDRVDFIGGPYLACWDSPPPVWAPGDYLAVLGSANNGSIGREYDRHFQGILKGGNAVIRRRTLERVGPYAEHLGPGGFSRLFSCEDEEMYLRLLEHGARGRYVPELIIYHYVPTSRLTPEYYRRWCFWRGVSRGLMDHRHHLPVPYFAGVPRFLLGLAVRGLVGLARGLVTPQLPADRFRDELRLWDVTGYLFGKHAYPLTCFSPVKNRRSGDREPLPRPSAPAQPGPGPEATRAAGVEECPKAVAVA